MSQTVLFLSMCHFFFLLVSLCAARGQRIEDPPLGVHGRGDPGHGRPAERSRGRQRQGEDETGDAVFSSGPESRLGLAQLHPVLVPIRPSTHRRADSSFS